MKYHNMFPQLRSSVGVDPVPELININIDSRKVRGTSNAPGHQTHHCPSPRLSLTDQRRSSISSAGVLTNLSSSTDLTGVQLEPVSHSGLLSVESSLQGGVAAEVVHQRKVDFVLDELEVSSELVFPPASYVTPHSTSVTELVAELVPAGGETGRVNVAVVEVHPLAQSQYGQVVTETFRVEPGVGDGADHVVLLVFILLRPLVSAGVILTNPDLQTSGTANIVQVVGSCQHLGGSPGVVVVEVLRDDGAGSDKVVVRVEDETGPGKLSRRRLSMANT